MCFRTFSLYLQVRYSKKCNKRLINKKERGVGLCTDVYIYWLVFMYKSENFAFYIAVQGSI